MSSNYKKILAVVLSAVMLLAMTGVAYATLDGDLLGNGDADEETTEIESIIDEDTTAEEESVIVVPTTEEVESVLDDEETTAAEEESEVEDTTAAEEKKGYLLGDVNLDGAVRANDARLALRLAADLPIEYTDEMDIRLKAADYNRNGLVRANDARFILRVAADLDVVFGAETDPEAGTTAVYGYAECLEWTFYAD